MRSFNDRKAGPVDNPSTSALRARHAAAAAGCTRPRGPPGPGRRRAGAHAHSNERQLWAIGSDQELLHTSRSFLAFARSFLMGLILVGGSFVSVSRPG